MAHQACADTARTSTREFLACHDLHELVGRYAAIFLGKAETQQADSCRLGVELARKFASFVPFMRKGLDLLLDKSTHDLAKGFMFGGIERAFHVGLSGSNALQDAGIFPSQLAFSSCVFHAAGKTKAAPRGCRVTSAPRSHP